MASASPSELLERLRASASAVSKVADSISPEKVAEKAAELPDFVDESLAAKAPPAPTLEQGPQLETAEADATALQSEAEAMDEAEADENEAIRARFPPESFETPDRPTKRRRRVLKEAPKKKPAGAFA
ncbi:unnamed protein product [Symbiodinium sp. CCMP2592]|nr:unnamed protein product [Symbiodinium sp. CCMP2592]CAE7370550.1 unnamed protein product [Symbiodinium sp. CCMP2592]